MTDRLATYRAKRDFERTAEPDGEGTAGADARSFVVQKHAASHLHYDFRLELHGVLLSWAVPKGPSLDAADKRMAIHVEDHPLAYGGFEGTIPKGQYGAGSVIVWDRGSWEAVGDADEGLRQGKLVFNLHGQKLQGLWELVRIAKGGEKQEPWILFKKRDAYMRPKAEYDVLTALPDSVIAKPLRAAPRRRKPPQGEAAAARAPAAPAASDAASGAVPSPLPAKLKPQLATLATEVPQQGRWSFEIKFDGYRIMARIESGKATLITRGGHDWSRRMPALVRAVEGLGLDTAWLDGEIVVLGNDGAPDFNRLQKAFDRADAGQDIVYFLFDLPYVQGHDLRPVALSDRRRMLKALLNGEGTPFDVARPKRTAAQRRQTPAPRADALAAMAAEGVLRYSADFESDAASILASAARLNLEGLIAKRGDAPYVSARTDSWLKLKCRQRQEFVVCGYVDRSDGSPQVGSLLLGVHDEQGQLISVGGVGTGWDTEEAAALKRKLVRIETGVVPFAAGVAKPGRWSRVAPGTERWVKPTLVAEVEFADWTPDHQVRHAVYVALRGDKPAKAVVRESASRLEQARKPPHAVAKRPPGAVKVSHGERVIDASSGLTKLDLVRYYESVADWILPHLAARPTSLVRAPGGIEGQQFFQKHDDKLSIPGLRELSAELWPAHPPLLEVPNAKALASAAQMNVVEFHTWNSKVRSIDLPDRMVFDLDPGEGTSWRHVQEAALLVRSMLSQLGLKSWLKTSGGKGLHVVVPLTPKLDYDTVKAFSQSVVRHLAKTIPSRFVAKSGPANRVGKLFVDYLRNGFGATTAAAFSARARPGLGVSMPISWDELAEIKRADQWNVANARDHLSFRTTDPWQEYGKARQSLAKAMRALSFDPADPAGRTRAKP